MLKRQTEADCLLGKKFDYQWHGQTDNSITGTLTRVQTHGAQWGFSYDRFQRRGQVPCHVGDEFKAWLAGRLSLISEWWEAGEGIPVKECVTEGVEENGHF